MSATATATATVDTLGPKHRDGHRYVTIASHDVDYRVKVVTMDKGKYTYVYIAGGDFPVFKEVGMLVKRGVGSYEIRFRNQDGSMGSGYTDNGKLVHFVATLVHTFVGNAHYAALEAAKSPEQVAEETAAREAAGNQVRNDMLARQAEKMLAEIERFVPNSTVHYAVEDARRALTTLVREAQKGSIKTVAAPAVKR